MYTVGERVTQDLPQVSDSFMIPIFFQRRAPNNAIASQGIASMLDYLCSSKNDRQPRRTRT